MFSKKFLRDSSHEPFSIIVAKHKMVLAARTFLFGVGVLVYFYADLILQSEDIALLRLLMVPFYLGLMGLIYSMGKPYGKQHIVSVYLFVVPYVLLPMALHEIGIVFSAGAVALAALYYFQFRRKLNVWMQIALLAPTTVYITVDLIYRMFV